jgi:hypothetical protein
MCVCWVDLCVSVIDMHIMEEHPNLWELWRTVTICWILEGGSCKGVVVICKTCETQWGVEVCYFLSFMCCQFWGMVSWVLVYAIYLDSRVYVTRCNLRFGFLWKFNGVLGLCGLKKLKRKGRLMGSRKRDQRDLTL